MNIVDTHANVYHTDETIYPMVEEPCRPPKGTGSVEYLRAEMNAAGVDRAVLVQTGSAYKWDNRLVAAMSLKCREWAVWVCTLGPNGADSIDQLE